MACGSSQAGRGGAGRSSLSCTHCLKEQIDVHLKKCIVKYFTVVDIDWRHLPAPLVQEGSPLLVDPVPQVEIELGWVRVGVYIFQIIFILFYLGKLCLSHLKVRRPFRSSPCPRRASAGSSLGFPGDFGGSICFKTTYLNINILSLFHT